MTCRTPAVDDANSLDPEQLFTARDPNDFQLSVDGDVGVPPDDLGQERAIEAMRFGVGMACLSYNIFAWRGRNRQTCTLAPGTQTSCRNHAGHPGWCYVHDFQEPGKLTTLCFPRRASLNSPLLSRFPQGLHPNDPIASGLPFVGVEHVESGSGAFNFNNGSRIGSQRSTTFRFDERHVLYAKLRPYLNKVATPGFSGRCSTELVPLLPREGVDREFIAYLLRRSETVEYVMSSVTGARMPRTDMKALMSLPVQLPPLDEQYRFADFAGRAFDAVAKTRNAAVSAAALSASFMNRFLRDDA